MTANHHVTVGTAVFGNDLPLCLIAGPCQLESRGHAFDIAGRLKEMAAGLGIGLADTTAMREQSVEAPLEAAVLGGTSLFGGMGTVIGTIVGALMIGLINNGLILMGLEFSQQLIARGGIIILAVALSQKRS